MPSRLSPWLLAVSALAACGDSFTAGESTGATGAGGGGTATSTGTASGSASGCADGTREAFIDAGAFPEIAGCSGGFQVPGLAAGVALVPACAREGGNDGPHPDGAGCSAVDLCANGWHVCNSAAEVAQRAPNGCDDAAGFFATRQAQGNDVCAAPPAVNNFAGCGTLGQLADAASCAPLDRVMRFDDCAATQSWHCGSDADQAQEGAIVIKDGSDEGGVVCCRDA